MANDWKWNAADSLSNIVFPSVQGVAVYQNEALDIVIRQEGSMGEDDTIVIVPLQHAQALINALKAVAHPDL